MLTFVNNRTVHSFMQPLYQSIAMKMDCRQSRASNFASKAQLAHDFYLTLSHSLARIYGKAWRKSAGSNSPTGRVGGISTCGPRKIQLFHPILSDCFIDSSFIVPYLPIAFNSLPAFYQFRKNFASSEMLNRRERGDQTSFLLCRYVSRSLTKKYRPCPCLLSSGARLMRMPFSL